jgi:hypothetical protein
VCVCWFRTWQTHARGHCPGGVGESGHLCPGSLATLLRAPWLGSLQSPPLISALCVGCVGTGSGKTTFPDQTLRFVSLGGDVHRPERVYAVQALSTLRPYPGVPRLRVACGEVHLSGECSISQQQLKCCSCGGNHTANYQGSVKWKEAKAALD